MHWNYFEFEEKKLGLARFQPSTAENHIYQWVKEDKISPSQMAEMILFVRKAK